MPIFGDMKDTLKAEITAGVLSRVVDTGEVQGWKQRAQFPPSKSPIRERGTLTLDSLKGSRSCWLHSENAACRSTGGRLQER